MTDKRVPRERKHDDAPERIYLQVCDDADCKIPFDEHYEVTWARESITERSIEYVRADVACAVKAALRERVISDSGFCRLCEVGWTQGMAERHKPSCLATPDE